MGQSPKRRGQKGERDQHETPGRGCFQKDRKVEKLEKVKGHKAYGQDQVGPLGNRSLHDALSR